MNKSPHVALVTGASSGIGEVFARKLSAKGYHLVLVARRRERLERLAAELPSAEVLVADLAVDSDLLKIEHYIADEPRLDFLVNNAGFGVPGIYYESDIESLNKMHRLHIIAVARLTHAALRGMVERSKGSIINVSSVAGFIQAPFSVSYNASKSWINGFTEGLYLELRRSRSPVRVQALCPGFTYTEFQLTAGIDQRAIPKKLWMSAEAVVDTSLRCLERNKLFVVPGWRYRLFLAGIGVMPRPVRHFLAIKSSLSSRKSVSAKKSQP
ncbi:MAG: SDR family NAD(P)-dependent oxidoreductase [Acidobacteria bacterium]|nr:SDR family NAD(P)-dependent oxidoreductase [Acidobacteriota bacterium]